MARCKPERAALRAALAGLWLWPALAMAATPPDFSATYAFYRNGKLIGEARVSLHSEGAQWVMRGESRGTRGLAKFAGFSEQSSSRGAWSDGLPRPDSFQRAVEYAFKDREWQAEFNWTTGTVVSDYEDGTSRLSLPEGTQDSNSIGLAIRAGLMRGEAHWRLPMVDEDEIEMERFRAGPPHTLDTELGCLQVRTVEKLRGPESRRYTRTHHAAELGWVPVWVEHGKKGGDRMESRIVSLSLDGHDISAGTPCATS